MKRAKHMAHALYAYITVVTTVLYAYSAFACGYYSV